MTETKTYEYDVVYPCVAAGIEPIDLGVGVKTLAQLIECAGGTVEPIRIVRPTSMAYDYVTVPKNRKPEPDD